MPIGLPSAQMSAAEYLAWERQQEQRHEFYAGEVFAMAGGSTRHSALAVAFAAELRAAAQASGCHVLSSDQRVELVAGRHYAYPDVTLVCPPLIYAHGTADVLANPRVIVEVLSRSTEAYDRGDKWAAYQALASLREYVLVSQAHARIEVYRRDEHGWRYERFGPGETVTLGEGFGVSVDAIYADLLELPGD